MHCSINGFLQRREVADKRSYVCFVDYRKAYDTVPHEALFRKYMSKGVQGDALRSSERCMRTQRYLCVEHSGTRPLLQGLMQGCPMSPYCSISLSTISLTGQIYTAC